MAPNRVIEISSVARHGRGELAGRRATMIGIIWRPSAPPRANVSIEGAKYRMRRE